MASFGIRKSSEDCAIHQLNELFGNALDLDVIKNVAMSCGYDVMESSNKLIEISATDSKNLISMDDIEMHGTRSTSYSNAIASGTSSTRLSTSASYTALPPNKSRKTLDFERTVSNINKGYKVLVMMRGLPGSGKSMLATKILEHTVGYDANYQLHILSTDDYFCQNARGVYEYDLRKLEEAHNWNQSRAFQAMSRGFSPVIIDNTNSQMWEMKSYATMAIDYGYILEIVEPDTHWCFNDKELTKRNHHGVNRAKIKDMIDRYEKNITAKKLLHAYNLVYTFQKPPQMRLYPPIGVAVKNTNNVDSAGSRTTNTENVDAINLMNFDDIEDDTSKKIQPVVNGTLWSQHNGVIHDKDIFVISSDDENEASKDDLYAQWGIKESTLKSWDIVTPLQDFFDNNSTALKLSGNVEAKIETGESSTCTEDDYFRIIQNDNVLPGMYGNLKVLETVNRDINHSTPKREPQISMKLTLDKGCMTEDIYDDYENHIAELESLFPGVPKTHLTYWYSKCKGDLEWTIEFLLEAKDEVVSLIEDDGEATETRNNLPENNSPSPPSSPKSDNCLKKKTRKCGGSDISQEDKIQIKKLLESKFDIGGEHYSQHLRRVKQYKLKNVHNDEISRPSTSEIHNTGGPAKSKSESSVLSVGDVITIDSDVEFDEVDVDNSCEKRMYEDTIELNLGDVFVSQLEDKFADPNIQYPKGFLPVVQMPIGLAKQLYTFYIESVYQQMEIQQYVLETLVREDEEFARKLQAKEQEEVDACQPAPTPNLKDIMDAQRNAQKTYQTEIEKWKNFNPDTLAARLTKQKLISIFPTIPQDILVEVLNAHDNKYVDTVETLIASTRLENVGVTTSDIKEPPIHEAVLEEMREAQRKHSIEEYEGPEQRVEAERYREEANKYLNKRKDLYQRAQQYYQRGMTEVAQFYSGLASLQTIYFDRANNMAATAFLDDHSKRLQDFNTLDLHFLYVKEAVPALDLFLDRNINLLKHSTTKNSEYLQIITGRGKRSENGVSKIKPVVMSRLKKRGIKFVPLNPGLLKVKKYEYTKSRQNNMDSEAKIKNGSNA